MTLKMISSSYKITINYFLTFQQN